MAFANGNNLVLFLVKQIKINNNNKHVFPTIVDAYWSLKFVSESEHKHLTLINSEKIN